MEVPPKLQELHDSVCNIIVEYTIFLEVLASFLKSIKEVNRSTLVELSVFSSIDRIHGSVSNHSSFETNCDF